MENVEMLLNLTGNLPDRDLEIRRALVSEGLGRITAVTLEVISRYYDLQTADFIGKNFTLTVADRDKKGPRYFAGLCVSAEYIGSYNTYSRYIIELRSNFWLLTRQKNSRVLQNMSVADIAKLILGDYGIYQKVRTHLSHESPTRDYVLQYRETDFDFLSRLFEEEGIYYYFTSSASGEEMVLVDDNLQHDYLSGPALEYREGVAQATGSPNQLISLQSASHLVVSNVALTDHNFENNNAALLSKKFQKVQEDSRLKETYLYPGRFRDPRIGEDRARVSLEAEVAHRSILRGISDATHLACGFSAVIRGHNQLGGETDFLITAAEHAFQSDGPLSKGMSDATSPREVKLPPEIGTRERLTRFEVIPRSVPYRSPQLTPWPEIPGVLNAIVVGPEGQEIETDIYGRVRIQFLFDIKGEQNEKSGAFVRVMQPWTGKGWGMQAVPRIGQEVMVGFENGDPDRPIILGMVYNAQSMPPWPLPENMTQTGIRTNSTKGGHGYNELNFEDKKDAEKIFFQAERDFEQNVKNNATLTVGCEHRDPGDMTVTIHHDLTETIKTGDHSFTIESGNQTIAIDKDKTENIRGNSQTTVKSGNSQTTIESGDMSQTVNVGNFTLKTTAGKVEVEAGREITLKVGSNSLKIDQSGITISGINIKIEGIAMLETSAPFSTVKADAILTLKGAITMIN